MLAHSDRLITLIGSKDLEDFRAVIPEYKDTEQLVVWRNRVAHAIVLTESVLYGREHELFGDTLKFTV